MTLYKYGSTGPVVVQIQRALKLYPDGKFLLDTEAAVRAFQKDHGLKVDGIVGPATLAKLIPVRFKKSRRVIKEIIVHCTATAEGANVTPAMVRNWHIRQGWSDIGYHYLIGLHGETWTCRDVDIQGAHCADGGHNRYSIGVCYVGGLAKDNKTPKDTRTDKQRYALIDLLCKLRVLYPDAKIYGHRDFARKDCPCFDARTEYKDI